MSDHNLNAWDAHIDAEELGATGAHLQNMCRIMQRLDEISDVRHELAQEENRLHQQMVEAMGVDVGSTDTRHDKELVRIEQVLGVEFFPDPRYSAHGHRHTVVRACVRCRVSRKGKNGEFKKTGWIDHSVMDEAGSFSIAAIEDGCPLGMNEQQFAEELKRQQAGEG
jgi:hypothetical protein